jgi:hypothetical protein
MAGCPREQTAPDAQVGRLGRVMLAALLVSALVSPVVLVAIAGWLGPRTDRYWEGGKQAVRDGGDADLVAAAARVHAAVAEARTGLAALRDD